MEPGRYTFADTTPDASGSGTASQHSGFRELVEKAELSEEAGLDPERVFQDFATLDLLSSGRAEIMAGRGSFIEFFHCSARAWRRSCAPVSRRATDCWLFGAVIRSRRPPNIVNSHRRS